MYCIKKKLKCSDKIKNLVYKNSKELPLTIINIVT